MRLQWTIPLTLVAALFVAAACGGDDLEPVPSSQPRLLSVSVSETTLVLNSKGTVELPFRVEEPDYVFKYSPDAPDCQIRLTAKDGKAVTEFRISRIAPGAEKGSYTAFLTDLGVEDDYSREPISRSGAKAPATVSSSRPVCLRSMWIRRAAAP